MADTEHILETWTQLDGLAHELLSPLETEAQYQEALHFVDALMTRVGQDERHPLVSLLILVSERVEAYEDRHHPVPTSTPSRLLAFLMADRDLTQTQLARETGIDQSNLSKLLKGERDFNARQIKALSDYFQVNPAVFFE